MQEPQFQSEKQLKSDVFGSIEQGVFVNALGEKQAAIKRTYTRNPVFRPVALLLARNERNALKRLAALSALQVPKLLHAEKSFHLRSFIQGCSMHHLKTPLQPVFFSAAKTLVTDMRKQGVVNNDLAKEANWIVSSDGLPVLADFQLALTFKRDRKLLRVLSREDLRHLLKHKRKYMPEKLSLQESTMLQSKSVLSRVYAATFKTAYRFFTRTILRWEDRTSPEER